MRTLRKVTYMLVSCTIAPYAECVPLAADEPAALNAAAATANVADAAESRDWERMASLIQAGQAVNAAQADGMTALHWAVLHSERIRAEQLLQAGAAVDSENRYGVRPLALACENAAGGLVELLLRAGADVDATTSGGESMLMLAARAGRQEAVHALLAAGADVNAREHKQQTALMWAAAEGHTAVVRQLFDAGADLQAATPAGWNALFFAVREGRTETAQLLLRHGMDVNVPRKTDRGALGPNPLLLAVENGHFETAAALLDAGADPNAQPKGHGALHAVAAVRRPVRGDGDPPPVGSGQLGSLGFVRLLVSQGGDVNLRLRRGQSGFADFTTTGCTAFVLAAQTGDLALLEVLLELGADPRIPNADGATAVLAAAGVGDLGSGLEAAGTESESIEVLRRLQQLGLDINVADENGETAMHGAAYQNWPLLIDFLDQQGMKPEVWNRPNRWGWTPLIIAHGYREGNFRPDAATIACLERVMRRRGQSVPVDPGRDVEANQQSWDRKPKKEPDRGNQDNQPKKGL
ncbi:MAG: ankyrin repeat domain-containing protein [Planctomycetaceae bacterium]